MNWNGRTVLITGGTGSLGKALVSHILPQKPRRLIVLSRDELKQHEMRQVYSDAGDSPLRYFIGDVRDPDRLKLAFRDVDIVIHAAALKQVPACEYNPFESVATNVIGARNVIDAAMYCDVPQVLLISSDKACQPVNTYGACKALAERLFIQANAYAGAGGTRFSVCRYGNVVGSRGSVMPLFLRQRESGTITITDERMTRFWLTLTEAVNLIEQSLTRMRGGEVFIPRIPSCKVTDLAEAIAPGCQRQVIGIRPGEKLHESLIGEDEARQTLDAGDLYIIQPAHPWWRVDSFPGAVPVPDGWRYTSDTNDRWLSVAELRALLNLNHPIESEVSP